jgi:hypothetical protein
MAKRGAQYRTMKLAIGTLLSAAAAEAKMTADEGSREP